MKPQHAIEVDVAEVAKDLRERGCPYHWQDPRAEAWMEGYKAGLAKGESIALQAIRDEYAGGA